MGTFGGMCVSSGGNTCHDGLLRYLETHDVLQMLSYQMRGTLLYSCKSEYFIHLCISLVVGFIVYYRYYLADSIVPS